MQVKKVFNNNVVLCTDGGRQEAVVMGKGLGFNKFPGNAIEERLIEKTFLLKDEKSSSVFDKLAREIPLEHIELASEIIQRGRDELSFSLNDGILITLADHISYMLQRMKEGVAYISPLQWEIKSIYPEEYSYSQKAVQYLRDKTGNDISETEASFITHLRYFVKRQLQGEALEENTSLLSVIKGKCPRDYNCALKIKKYLESAYEWVISEDELLYLTLHLN